MSKAGPRNLNSVGDPVDRLILAENGFLDVVAQGFEPLLFVAYNRFWWNFCHSGNGVLDHLHRYPLWPSARRQKLHGRTDLVDNVDRLVRQISVVYIFSG